MIDVNQALRELDRLGAAVLDADWEAEGFTIFTPGALQCRLVGKGEVLEATDWYHSSSGGWEKCPCPGLTYNGGALWVRPL